MRPDEDQLGDYKAAMENLRNADSCDSCGKPIEPGAGFTITSKRAGIQNFHKDANACANAPEVKKTRGKPGSGNGQAIARKDYQGK